MSRIIKFRAWDVGKMWNRVMAGEPNPTAWSEEKREWLECTEKAVVMQFTGLLDKNGKEVFEGDIVEFLKSTRTGEVVSLVVKWFQYSGHQGWWPNEIEDMSVIGNIYENPELLKESK